jgi:uncharacterized protein YjbI with pentapeptide repeats
MIIKSKIDGSVLWDNDELRGAQLCYADLAGVDLRGADISHADLRGADLSRARLQGIRADGANFFRVTLLNADLYNAHLSGASFVQADLRYAGLSRANLFDANFEEADFFGAQMDHAIFRDANLGGYIGKVHKLLAVVSRSDGYQFAGFLTNRGELGILAGCQNRLLASYREHVKTYADAHKIEETSAILDFLERRYNAEKP